MSVEIVESWNVVDRWWTETPQRRYFVILQAPRAPRACVYFDNDDELWRIAVEDGDAHGGFVTAPTPDREEMDPDV